MVRFRGECYVYCHCEAHWCVYMLRDAVGLYILDDYYTVRRWLLENRFIPDGFQAEGMLSRGDRS